LILPVGPVDLYFVANSNVDIYALIISALRPCQGGAKKMKALEYHCLTIRYGSIRSAVRKIFVQGTRHQDSEESTRQNFDGSQSGAAVVSLAEEDRIFLEEEMGAAVISFDDWEQVLKTMLGQSRAKDLAPEKWLSCSRCMF
jgi:hypothetical protein